MDDIELSIIMPCLNEVETLGSCIDKAQKFLRDNDLSGEIVIGDNGSTDGSIGLALQAGVRLVHVAQKGYGAACRGAINEAYGKFIIMGDSDDSYDFYNLMPFVEKLRDGYQLVMGNRFKGGIRPGAMPFKNRYLGNPVLSLIGRVLFSSNIGDFHCGLRGFTKIAFDRMQVNSTGMEFASEIVFKSQLMKLKTTEVPTTLSPDGRSRKPHLRPWRDGWRHLRLMFLFSPNFLFLIPGVVCIASGISAMAVLSLSGSITIGGLTFSNTTLVLSGGLTMLGLQAAIFGILAKYYGARELLLPYDPWIHKFVTIFNTEMLLIIGLALFIGGLVGVTLSIIKWSAENFGDLIPFEILSITVPSVVSMVCGIEIIMFGLFIGIIELKKINNGNYLTGLSEIND